ncbi:sporulation protein YpjB [Paenibacillus endophyticus]|uniref:Sporulation protein YpjB n=1 Tax=Paenibacillus endophyticus TaxID=1294268 RepID=A0A7W5C6Y2_9BACL|nr:sporulation protein YpjB [Paenibacillus endophyticus]MBB3151814.1 sporulation protein YpjB [Paenibacillus endophyticus]
MKIRFIIPFVLCILMTAGYANSLWNGNQSLHAYADLLPQSTERQLQRFDAIATSIYEAAYSNNKQAGFQHIQLLKQLMADDLMQSAGSLEGWSAIESDAKQLEKKLVGGSSNSNWLMEAAKIRLAADALVHSDHALWLQYEKVMLDDLSRVEKAWKRQTDDGAIAARASMTSLENHVERISSALSIQFGLGIERELMERIQYTNRLLEANASNKTNEAMIDRSLQALKASMDRLIDKSRSTESMPVIATEPVSNPLSWTLFLGAVISAVLAWSGWRKYKSDPFGVKPLP